MARNNLKILGLISSYINKGRSADEAINKLLAKEGFSPDEIDEVCSWLKGLTINGDFCMAVKDDKGDFYVNRVQNTGEPLKINGDAYSFLVRLREMGLIDSKLHDEIIETAMLSADAEIGMDDIKGIAAMLIFDHASGQWRADIINALNDRWEKVYH